MSSYQVEEKLGKIAEELASEYRCGAGNLNAIIKRAQDKNMLNDHEVETLCGKVNHLVFKEKFAQDKLALFDIAKFDEILKVDRAMNIVEYKVAMHHDGDDMSKAAEENTPGARNIDDVPITPNNAALLMQAGEENIDDIRQMRSGREKEFESIRNRVIELARNGESLDDIYAVLRDTWGEGNEEDLRNYFTQLISELKLNGYVDKDKEFTRDANVDDVEETEPLKQAAENVCKIAEQMMLREAAHEIIMRKLAGNGYDEMAWKLENKVNGDYYGLACSLYKKADELKEKTAARALPVDMASALRSALVGGAILTGAIAAGGAATASVDAIRKSVWRNKLREKYPELKQIPEQRYRDLYDSIAGLEPELLKAPYALKEMIMAHNQYGTIDSGTIIKLLESGRKNHPHAPLVAKSMASAMTLNPGYQIGY